VNKEIRRSGGGKKSKKRVKRRVKENGEKKE